MVNMLEGFRKKIFYAGAGLSAVPAVFPLFSGMFVYAAGMYLWALLPYVIFRILGAQSVNVPAVRASGIFLLMSNALAYIFVFFFMKVEAGIVMLHFVPFWLAVFVLPVGFFAGWIYGKLTQKKEKDEDGAVKPL